jgi:DIS3-like exonuclease 2
VLQKGKMSSHDLMKTNPLPKSRKIIDDKAEEIERNKHEVQRLNQKIYEKITREVKPKLMKIIGGAVNGSRKKTISESSQNSTRHDNRQFLQETLLNERPMLHLPRQTRPVPIGKTLIRQLNGDGAEIYRYSIDDLLQLQSTATWKIVPRLLELKICATPLSDSNKLIMKLINIKDEKVLFKAILDEAEERKFVKRTSEDCYEFCKVASEKTEKRNEKTAKKSATELDFIKSNAKSDEELNEAIYRHEFIKLFGGSLHQPLTEAIQELTDNKKAFIIEGEIRVNGKNNQEAYVTHPKGLMKDVCVENLILRRQAFHGDFVKVLVKQEEEIATDTETPAARKTGCVLEILEKRHSRRVIGSISSVGNQQKRHVIFNVRDTKVPSVRVGRDGIPKDIEISERMLMVVEITSWCHDQPKGKIVEIIGDKGELKAENAAILLQHNLNPLPYSPEILEQLPAEPFVIPESEYAYREDLRKKCIFSIDPESARDLDDALSCEELPNGNLEIGVHISDVSYFLKEDSALDLIVKEKATTIYLVDQVYHMLPVPLCLLCSLLPGSDKMAYSVFWEMKQDSGDIVSTRFTRSVVNSCGKLSYEHAQNVIEGKEAKFPEIHNGFSAEDVSNVILKLQNIAVMLRNKRKENGALKIDQPKIAFKFDDDKYTAPSGFFKYPIKDSNKLIEEFMLLANISVAEFIYKKFPEISLLRSHFQPNEGGLKKLVKTLEKHGLQIDVSSSSAVSDSMEKLIKSDGMNAALNLMVSKTMTRARYFCSETAKEESDFWHYALSIPIYTHFTSPIRRYADVLVHRVLNAALEYEPVPSRSPEEVQQLANVCNAQKYSAKLAGDDSSNLYFMSFIKSLKSKTMLAGVLGIYDYNFEVVLIETGHVIKVFYKVSCIFIFLELF